MELAWKVDEGQRVYLTKYDPAHIEGGIDRDKAAKEVKKLGDELSKLQELLYASQHHSVLIVLQGMDTSGKDGTIRHVFASVNPQGCYVHSFKQPTQEELLHDFLWRVHKVTPARGTLGIFNRSHYEDVLVVRVHNLVPEPVWSRRYEEINQFEQLLAQSNTIILKFFLHISFEEQEKRLLAREDDRDKAWKIDPNDWVERSYWDDYQRAYEDVLSRCSTQEAPWYIVPSDHKWYRNLAVAHTLVQVLQPYKDEWQQELEKRGEKELQELHNLRASRGRLGLTG